MIQADSLRKSFARKGSRKERITAVKSLSLKAQDGQITGLLGANGAGKSTSLRMLVGLIEPEYGHATIDQWDTIKHKLELRQHIGYLPHNAGVYPRLTARENIHYFATLAGLKSPLVQQRTDELVQLLGMEDFIDRRTEGFSQGQKTKVALARALVHRPRNLILDEPTNGLDVISTRNLRKILMALRDLGHCVLISSHIMQEISLLCDHIAIINQGEVAIEGSIEHILATTGQSGFEEAFVIAIGESLESN